MAALSTVRAAPMDRLAILYHELLARFAHIHRGNPLSKRNYILVVTVAFALTIATSGYTLRALLRTQKPPLASRESLLNNGTRTIFVPYKSSYTSVTIHPTKTTTFDAHRRLFLNPPRQSGMRSSVPPANVKPGINAAFLHQFLSLSKIMVPRIRSKECALLVTHASFLCLRTYLSLLIARLDGEIVRSLVSGSGSNFLFGLGKWLSIGAVSSYTNSMIKFLQSKISIAFRTRLTRYIHDLYLSPSLAYYKLHHLDGGTGAGGGAETYITQDLTLFCDSAASLYSSLGKPLVDLITFNHQLYRSLGGFALSGLLLNYFATATLLRKLSPPFGKMKAVEGRKEGEFRALHARLIANAEEVAFYNGGWTEHILLDEGFMELKKWMESIYKIKVGYNMLEDFVLKYSWSAFGYLITSLPVFLPSMGGDSASSTSSTSEALGHDSSSTRTQAFITNKRLMLSLADAGGRMMYSIKDLSELAGYTSRVFTLVSTLHRVHASAYTLPASIYPEPYSLADVQGTLQTGFKGVRMEGVPVVAPSLWPEGGDELVQSLSFVLQQGQHLLVTGPNGAGKSAVARILAGLWPTYRGLVSRPAKGGIMFLPQRPYLTPTGTLRDQVLYPSTFASMQEQGRTDDEVQAVLETVRLGYLRDREGGWETRKLWRDVLSGGERQRMGFARLLWTLKSGGIAVIDEGTSAVSSDVEGVLYEAVKAQEIALLTISTRASLKRYHDFALTLGLGEEGTEFEMSRIGTARERAGVEKELAELRERLGEVDGWKERLKAVESELAKVWVDGDEQELLEAKYVMNDGTAGGGGE